jgi:hypothetical protein
LGDSLLELILLRIPGCAARLEQCPLGRHHVLDGGLCEPAFEFRRRLDPRRSIALGLEPRLAREVLVELLGDNLEIGAGYRLVEANQKLALGNALPLMHLQLADNAAGRVLHLLDAGVDDELASGHDRAGQGGGRRPQSDGAAEQSDERGADDGGTAQGLLMPRWLRRLLHD